MKDPTGYRPASNAYPVKNSSEGLTYDEIDPSELSSCEIRLQSYQPQITQNSVKHSY
jgi:hypothetical protein